MTGKRPRGSKLEALEQSAFWLIDANRIAAATGSEQKGAQAKTSPTLGAPNQNEVRSPAVTTQGSNPGVTVAYVEFSNPKPCVE